MRLLDGNRREPRKRLSAGPSRHATSPITEISGWPGIVRSGSTLMRPLRSVFAPVAWASDSISATGCTPAAQMTVLESIRLLVTVGLVGHAALVDVRDARALANGHAELGQVVGDLLGEPRAEGGDHPLAGVEQDHPARRSRFAGRRLSRRAVIASWPAISTPVGPPPTTTNVIHSARSAGSSVRSACSRAP